MYVCLVFLFVRICSRMYICMCVSHLHVVGDKKSPPPEGGVTCAYECMYIYVSEWIQMFVCVDVCSDTSTYVYMYVWVWHLFYILYGTYLLVLTNYNKNNNKTSKGLLFSNNNKNNNNIMHLFVPLFIKWKDELWNITAKATTNLSICMPTTTTMQHTALANNMCVNLNFCRWESKIIIFLFRHICIYVCVWVIVTNTQLIIALQTRAHRKQPYAQAKTIVCTPIFAYMYIYICVCVRTTLFSLKTKLYYS